MLALSLPLADTPGRRRKTHCAFLASHCARSSPRIKDPFAQKCAIKGTLSFAGVANALHLAPPNLLFLLFQVALPTRSKKNTWKKLQGDLLALSLSLADTPGHSRKTHCVFLA
ncbi:MAG: hypothetical protein J6Y74_03140, partial [Clostridia bacterium]|nr:hypothetical protein [Clostridia bacterium]